MSKSIVSLLLLANAWSLLGQGTAAEKARQRLEYTRAHYTKYDYRIPCAMESNFSPPSAKHRTIE